MKTFIVNDFIMGTTVHMSLDGKDH